jgi:hypothetical protein
MLRALIVFLAMVDHKRLLLIDVRINALYA